MKFRVGSSGSSTRSLRKRATWRISSTRASGSAAVGPEQDVDGGEDELGPADLERGHQRRARHLLDRHRLAVPLQRRQHELARHPEELHLAGVVHEGQTLAVAGLAPRDVRDQVSPARAEPHHQPLERPQVGSDLLERHEVEAVDDLGDVGVGLRHPRSPGGGVELAQVPGADQQRVEAARGRHLGALGERLPELQELRHGAGAARLVVAPFRREPDGVEVLVVGHRAHPTGPPGPRVKAFRWEEPEQRTQRAATRSSTVWTTTARRGARRAPPVPRSRAGRRSRRRAP